MSDSSNWKAAESKAAEALNEFGIPAKRKTRAGNFAESTWDLDIDASNLPIAPIVDSKYSKARPFRELGLLRGIKKKYCKSKKDIAILYLRSYKERGGGFLVEDEIFSGLLSFFLGYMSREEVLKKWGIE